MRDPFEKGHVTLFRDGAQRVHIEPLRRSVKAPTPELISELRRILPVRFAVPQVDKERGQGRECDSPAAAHVLPGGRSADQSREDKGTIRNELKVPALGAGSVRAFWRRLNLILGSGVQDYVYR